MGPYFVQMFVHIFALYVGGGGAGVTSVFLIKGLCDNYLHSRNGEVSLLQQRCANQKDSCKTQQFPGWKLLAWPPKQNRNSFLTPTPSWDEPAKMILGVPKPREEEKCEKIPGTDDFCTFGGGGKSLIHIFLRLKKMGISILFLRIGEGCIPGAKPFFLQVPPSL